VEWLSVCNRHRCNTVLLRLHFAYFALFVFAGLPTLRHPDETIFSCLEAEVESFRSPWPMKKRQVVMAVTGPRRRLR
jgi:hypothetical protein